MLISILHVCALYVYRLSRYLFIYTTHKITLSRHKSSDNSNSSMFGIRMESWIQSVSFELRHWELLDSCPGKLSISSQALAAAQYMPGPVQAHTFLLSFIII